MPRLNGMTGAGDRVGRALRRAPRALYQDLWSAPVDPLPPQGAPGAPAWHPVLGMLLVLAAPLIAVWHVPDLVAHGAAVPAYAVLLVTLQAMAVLAGLWRPLYAWWASLVLMVVSVRIAESVSVPGDPFPWTGADTVLQSLALLLLSLRVRPRRSVLALAVTLAAGAVSGLPVPQGRSWSVGTGAAVAAAVVIGSALRALRVTRTQLVAQSGLTAEERSRRTLLEERTRIARELHDVVAHHMSVISIQAQVAPHLVENPSDELRENLTGIRENAVEALAELRRVLGVLRSEETGADGVRHAPQPTLDRLDELTGKVRTAGIHVDTETTGDRRPLAPGVELSAFRIVQEALSNVLRHAPGARARVEVGYQSAAVTVRVTNTAPAGPAAPSTGTGHGLLGMRERASMLGGDLSHGQLPGGGWEVVATLPLEDPA